MARGAKRRHDPRIPAHIDQTKIPTGIYFDHRRGGHWYTLSTDEGGNRRRKNIAGHKALLSDLHRIAEERTGTQRGTLSWLASEFRKGEKFLSLSQDTQSDYDHHSGVLCSFPTKIGKPLGELQVDRFSIALVQLIVDKIASEGTPSKAVHCLRYLRRLLNWGKARDYCQFILPSRTIELPKERKQRRLPTPELMTTLIQFAFERGKRHRGQAGAVAPYLWMVIDLSYLCRLRGIETVTLCDANASEVGLTTNRRKGSRDNTVRWTPRLKAAFEAAQARRNSIWEAKKMPTPLRAEQRPLIVAAHGGQLQKSSLNSAWDRLMQQAVAAGILEEVERFGLHDLKRRGITDTAGNRADKQQASGHKSASMMDVYDLSMPIVDPSAL